MSNHTNPSDVILIVTLSSTNEKLDISNYLNGVCKIAYIILTLLITPRKTKLLGTYLYEVAEITS